MWSILILVFRLLLLWVNNCWTTLSWGLVQGATLGCSSIWWQWGQWPAWPRPCRAPAAGRPRSPPPKRHRASWLRRRQGAGSQTMPEMEQDMITTTARLKNWKKAEVELRTYATTTHVPFEPVVGENPWPNGGPAWHLGCHLFFFRCPQHPFINLPQREDEKYSLLHYRTTAWVKMWTQNHGFWGTNQCSAEALWKSWLTKYSEHSNYCTSTKGFSDYVTLTWTPLHT